MKKPIVDPFYTLRELVEMRVFGKKSIHHLRIVAQLQRKDPKTYPKKPRMSWTTVHSYPLFVSEGNEWGLYGFQIEEHRAKKQGFL